MTTMNACNDSLTSIQTDASWYMPLVLGCALLLTTMGCSRVESESYSSSALQGVNPQLISHHGKLQFVNDVDLGRRLSKELRKPCMMFFTADWCTYCQQMEETAFSDPSVGELSKNFVCVLVDADRYPKICQEFSVTGYPTIQFVSATGRPLNRLVGSQSAADLASGMRAALKRFAWLNDLETQRR